MTKQEKDNRVPLWERMNLTLEEAAAYTGIGTDKLRELSNRESCDFVLWVGISHKKLLELASDAGAIYRIDGTVLINKDIFDTYLERFHEPATGKGREEMMDER